MSITIRKISSVEFDQSHEQKLWAIVAPHNKACSCVYCQEWLTIVLQRRLVKAAYAKQLTEAQEEIREAQAQLHLQARLVDVKIFTFKSYQEMQENCLINIGSDLARAAGRARHAQAQLDTMAAWEQELFDAVASIETAQ